MGCFRKKTNTKDEMESDEGTTLVRGRDLWDGISAESWRNTACYVKMKERVFQVLVQRAWFRYMLSQLEEHGHVARE